VVDGVVSIPFTGCLADGTCCRSDGPKQGADIPPFVVGQENRLVGLAIRAVLQNSPVRYNPIVFYGPPGTGKSHVARGLAGACKSRFPSCVTIYTTAVDFARELTNAIETQAVEDFRIRYRQAHFVVLDDVGLLAAYEAAQRELTYTSDSLTDVGHCLIATAAAAPTRLPDLLPGLRSRLQAGLTVPLLPPGRDTRFVLVKQLAEDRGIRIPDVVSQALADSLAASVPELLGVLVQLELDAKINADHITMENVKRYLALRAGSR